MKVYLDNNRATMVDPQVIEEMQPFYTELYANPSALHGHAKAMRKPCSDAMEKIYAGIHAKKSDTIAITSGSNESNERLFMSIYLHTILTGQKRDIIISDRESDAINNMANFIASQGCRVTVVPIDSDGIIEASSIKNAITTKTALVSITMVDAQTGAIMPIDEISQICDEHKVWLHSDATHAIGKIPVDVQMLGVDFLTFSAETFHGPTGVGALYVKDGNGLQGLDKPSQNTTGIIGMAKAIELSVDAQAFEMEDVRELRDSLEEALRGIPDSIIVTPWTHRVANTILIAFKDIESELLLYELNKVGISAYMENGSSIIETIGANSSMKHSLVGFALSRFNTEEEIAYTIEKINQTVNNIRQRIACTQEET
ncbi:MAG TPA: aminotransferase class V-fold PLP-dependent enzyme [Sulfurovum sp.]|nr:aminotransferase class V-fold PLP-dependent enzyme [Sulfurovum sp.]